MTHNKRNLQLARPKLVVISPLTYYIVMGYSALNFILAIAFILQSHALRLAISPNLTMAYVWSGVFACLATGLLIGLIRNDWEMMRYFLIGGMFVKTLFTYALIALAIQIGLSQIFSTLGLWLTLTWIQSWTVIYFMPKGDRHG